MDMTRYPYILAFVLLVGVLPSCKKHTFTVKPPEAPSAVDPDVPECTEIDAAALIAGHIDDLSACTEHLGCRSDHVRKVTVMLGCNGTSGALYVLSHKDLRRYTECMSDLAGSWDFSSVCTDAESECAWTFPVEIECKIE